MGEMENLESARMIIKDPSLKGAIEQVINYGRVPTEREPRYQKDLIRDVYDTFKDTFKQVFNLKKKEKYLNILESELGKKAQELKDLDSLVDGKIETVNKREKELEEESTALKAYEQELNQEKEKLNEIVRKNEELEKKYRSKYTSLKKYGIDMVGVKPGPKKGSKKKQK